MHDARSGRERRGAEKDELYLMKGDPLLKTLENDPCYKAFLRTMKLQD
jgi:hypothetical protein